MEEQKLTVRAVERAMDILLCFTEKRELGLTEISAKVVCIRAPFIASWLLLRARASSCATHIQTSIGWAFGFGSWQESLDQTDNPAVLFLPEMERLRDAIGETVSLYIRDGMRGYASKRCRAGKRSAGSQKSAPGCPCMSVLPARCCWPSPTKMFATGC